MDGSATLSARLFVYHQKHIDKEEVGTVLSHGNKFDKNRSRYLYRNMAIRGSLISYSGMGEWLIIKIFLVLLMTFLYGFFILLAQISK